MVMVIIFKCPEVLEIKLVAPFAGPELQFDELKWSTYYFPSLCQWILTLISVFIAFLYDNFCKNFKLKKKFYKIFLEKFPQRFNGLAESSKSWGQKWYEGGKMKVFKTKSKLCKFDLKKLINSKKLVRKLLLETNMATILYFTK